MTCMYHHIMLKNCCSRECKYFMCIFVCIYTCTFVDQPHTTTSPTHKVCSCHAILCCIHFVSSPVTTMTICEHAGDDTFIKSTNNGGIIFPPVFLQGVYTQLYATMPYIHPSPETDPQSIMSPLPALNIQQEMLLVLISLMVECMLEELLNPVTPLVNAMIPSITSTQQSTLVQYQ